MIGCLPRVLEVPRVVADTEVPRILWVQCATSAECKTIQIAMSTIKDSWAVRCLNYVQSLQTSVCVRITTWVKSKDLTWLRWVGAHSIYVDICNLSSWLLEFSWCMPYKDVEHVIALKTSFLQKFTYIMYYYILDQNVGCLRVHSKYSLACHWLFYWPGMIEQDIMKSTLVMNMRARTLPSQNASRVKADGMGPSYRWRFPLRRYTQDLTIMVLLV